MEGRCHNPAFFYRMKYMALVKFYTSKKKDVDYFKTLLKEKKKGEKEVFSWALGPHKILKRFTTKKGNFLKKDVDFVEGYIDSFYKENSEEIKKRSKIIEKDWGKKEKIFLKLIKDLFGDSNFPRKAYKCYTTIWGIYPRFLEEGIFMIPWNHKTKKYELSVIAHEMLHFKFYNYIKKEMGIKKPEKDVFIWHISEIFNGIIQSSKPWLKVFKLKPMYYPFHTRIIKQNLLWWEKQKEKNVTLLIERIVDSVERNRRNLGLK